MRENLLGFGVEVQVVQRFEVREILFAWAFENAFWYFAGYDSCSGPWISADDLHFGVFGFELIRTKRTRARKEMKSLHGLLFVCFFLLFILFY